MDGGGFVQTLHLVHSLEYRKSSQARLPTTGEQQMIGVHAPALDGSVDATRTPTFGVIRNEATMREHERPQSVASAR